MGGCRPPESPQEERGSSLIVRTAAGKKRAPAIATTLRRGLNNLRNNKTLDPVSRPGKTPHRPAN
jgi:hypothetical protein